MPTRREFLTTTSLAGAAALLPVAPFPLLPADGQSSAFISRRPPLVQRKFVSPAVEETIVAVAATIADAEPAWMFENCFPNTLDTTVTFRRQNGKPDTFVLTGDIPAMWLRDSTVQVWPDLPLAVQDDALCALLAGVINRQTQCILIDPNANAFNDGPATSPWQNVRADMKPEWHERRWEVDALCYPMRLAHGFWQATGAAVPVYYNPAKPAEAVLERHLPPQFAKGITSAFLIFLGGAAIVLFSVTTVPKLLAEVLPRPTHALFVTLAGGVGLFVLALALALHRQVAAARRWPAARGKIDSTTLPIGREFGGRKGSTPQPAQLVYTYTVAG